MTITEALAELKTLEKRIVTKREFVRTYLTRYDGLKDPLEKDGGSVANIQQTLQGIADLEKRIVDIRYNINRVNQIEEITLEGETKSIADWLIWRRDVAPNRQRFLNTLSTHLNDARRQAQSKGFNVIGANITQGDAKPTDIVVNLDEKWISQEIEKLQNILGQLDGQLSLKNATVMVGI